MPGAHLGPNPCPARENGASPRDFGELPYPCKKITGCPFVLLSTDNSLTEWCRREKTGACYGLVTRHKRSNRGVAFLHHHRQTLLSYPPQSSLPSPFRLFSPVSSMAILGWCRSFSADLQADQDSVPSDMAEAAPGLMPRVSALSQ